MLDIYPPVQSHAETSSEEMDFLDTIVLTGVMDTGTRYNTPPTTEQDIYKIFTLFK